MLGLGHAVQLAVGNFDEYKKAHTYTIYPKTAATRPGNAPPWTLACFSGANVRVFVCVCVRARVCACQGASVWLQQGQSTNALSPARLCHMCACAARTCVCAYVQCTSKATPYLRGHRVTTRYLFSPTHPLTRYLLSLTPVPPPSPRARVTTATPQEVERAIARQT